MSTIKSSDEHLTLNADGTSKDIKFQANGVEKASISSSGAFTSTTIDATKLTGDLPAISGANLTGISSVGGATGVDFNDNVKARFGTGNDLQLYHDGSDSFVFAENTATLKIRNSAGNIELQPKTGEVGVKAIADGATELYHNNVKKIETTANGVTVTGTAIATTDTDTSNTGNVTLDFAANQNFVLTLTGNTTLVNPTTEQVGQSGFITIIQDGTGSRTLAVGNQYFGVDGEVPEISTAANAIDVIPYIVIADGKILLGSAQKAFSDAS